MSWQVLSTDLLSHAHGTILPVTKNVIRFGLPFEITSPQRTLELTSHYVSSPVRLVYKDRFLRKPDRPCKLHLPSFLINNFFICIWAICTLSFIACKATFTEMLIQGGISCLLIALQ